MAALELCNIRKSYPGSGQETLKDIDLKIEDGEFLILVGPSGCGKSTLMNCIAGLEDITGGEIRLDGADISGASPKDRDIAMVFQSYALYPTMTVQENISFGLKMRKVPAARIDEEVSRVAKLLQIEHLLNRKPSQLSGGQQQRVAMGRALARRPKISRISPVRSSTLVFQAFSRLRCWIGDSAQSITTSSTSRLLISAAISSTLPLPI